MLINSIEIVSNYSYYISIEKGFTKSTCKSYLQDVEQYLDFVFSDFKIDSISLIRISHVRLFLVLLKRQGYSAKSINRKISSLRSFFKYCLRKKYILENVMSNITNLKVPSRIHQSVRPHQINRLFDRDFSSFDFYLYRAFLINVMIYCTGVRKQEISDIKVVDINFIKNQVLVTGKGDKQRLIPIVTGLIPHLQKYIELRSNHFNNPEQYLFLSNSGKKVNPRFIYQVVNLELSKVTSIQKKSPHLLRHSMATHLYENGASILAIKEILGHSSLAATQIYTSVSISKLKAEYSKVGLRKG